MCRAIRTISSDRGKIVSGADDQSVIVWDKQTFKLLEELKGHAPVRILQIDIHFNIATAPSLVTMNHVCVQHGYRLVQSGCSQENVSLLHPMMVL